MFTYSTNKNIVIKIEDNGIGMSKETQKRIFEKFYRVKGPDRGRAGTGLGLAICRGFVEAMGGRITAANRTDRSGAVFTVALPVPADVPRLDALEEAGG